MKFPQRLRHRKFFKTKTKLNTLITYKSALVLGKAGLQAIEQGKIKPAQIEACRVSIRRSLKKKKRKIKLWIRLFPYCWVSRKPVAMRMGKGKGNHDRWFMPISKGKILYEVNKKEKGCSSFSYYKAFRRAWRRLSIHSKLSLLTY